MFKSTLAPLIATLFLAISPDVVEAGAPVTSIKAPGEVIPAGKKIVYFDNTRVMTFDPQVPRAAGWIEIGKSSDWTFSGKLHCGIDGKGYCAVVLNRNGSKTLGLIDVSGNSLVEIPVVVDRILAVESRDKIYISRRRVDGIQEIQVVDGQNALTSFVDIMRPGEKFDFLPLDRMLRPVFVTGSGQVRLPGQQTPVPVTGGVSAGRSMNESSVFGANDLFQKYPDGKDRAVIWRRTYSSMVAGQIQGGDFETADFPMPSSVLPLTSNFATNMAGQVVGLTATVNSIDLVALCTAKGENGAEFISTKILKSFSSLSEVQVRGDYGVGFTVRVREPGQSERLSYVTFQEARTAGLGRLPCSQLDATIVDDIAIPGSSFPQGWAERAQDFIRPDGTKISGTLLRRSNGPITTLIVDVYGASGLLRSTLAAPNDFLQSEKMQGVAILSLVLPGDGNRGWDYASAGRSPKRTETIGAVADVLKVAKSQLLADRGKLIVRGGSAGGWLAVKTALLNPGLVDEVIAISAAYSFEPMDDAVRMADFFSTSDSIKDEEVAHCGKTFFRLIHGSEDQVIPLDRVKRFGAMMSAHKCTGALHIAVGGDHKLADFRDYSSNPETKKIVLWSHGFEE